LCQRGGFFTAEEVSAHVSLDHDERNENNNNGGGGRGVSRLIAAGTGMSKKEKFYARKQDVKAGETGCK
jgi:hypothetical protein